MREELLEDTVEVNTRDPELDLSLVEPHWLHTAPSDLCLHGGVVLCLGSLGVPAGVAGGGQ